MLALLPHALGYNFLALGVKRLAFNVISKEEE
jgi:hypothetical protein